MKFWGAEWGQTSLPRSTLSLMEGEEDIASPVRVLPVKASNRSDATS